MIRYFILKYSSGRASSLFSRKVSIGTSNRLDKYCNLVIVGKDCPSSVRISCLIIKSASVHRPLLSSICDVHVSVLLYDQFQF